MTDDQQQPNLHALPAPEENDVKEELASMVERISDDMIDLAKKLASRHEIGIDTALQTISLSFRLMLAPTAPAYLED